MLGTGNARGDVDNDLACSVVAIMAPSGKQLWQYDVTPGDHKACDSSTDLTLATLNIDGQSRRVLLHAPKDGSLHVIDADSGTRVSTRAPGVTRS